VHRVGYYNMITDVFDCLLLVPHTDSSHRDLVNFAKLEISNAVCTAAAVRLRARFVHCGGNEQTVVTCIGCSCLYGLERNLYNQTDSQCSQHSQDISQSVPTVSTHRMLQANALETDRRPTDTTMKIHSVVGCRRQDKRLVLRGVTGVQRGRSCGMHFRI
jgi:hypothetical protein